MFETRPFASIELPQPAGHPAISGKSPQQAAIRRARGRRGNRGGFTRGGFTRGGFSRGGFTLLELLLVMAIIVVMASLTTFAVMTFQTNAKADAARTQISTLSSACKMYKLNVGVFPSSLNDLIACPTGMNQNQWRGPYLDAQTVPLDPWLQPYVIGANNGERMIISSNGADRQAGTQDDISNNQ